MREEFVAEVGQRGLAQVLRDVPGGGEASGEMGEVALAERGDAAVGGRDGDGYGQNEDRLGGRVGVIEAAGGALPGARRDARRRGAQRDLALGR